MGHVKARLAAHALSGDSKASKLTNTYKFSQGNMPPFFFSRGMTSKSASTEASFIGVLPA